MATIRLTGVSDAYRVPRGLAEIFFNQGAGGGASATREVVVFAPKAAGGTATVNTRYELLNAGDAETYGGIGMPAHRFARKFFESGGRKLYAVFYAEAGGTAATKTILVSGPSTSAGTAHIVICGEDCSVAFANAAAVDDVGAALVVAINNKSWLPVTAAFNSGTDTITITSRVTGVCSNVNIKVRTSVDGTGLTLGAGGDLTGGAAGTAEATSIATSLAAVASTSGLYFFCYPGGQAAADYACATALKTALSTRSAPNPGLRSVGIFANRDTPANDDTMAAALNYERLQQLWMENSEHDAAEIVGQVAAIRQKYEQADSGYNFAGYGSRGEGDWSLKPTYLDSDWPTDSEQDTAINHGYTPIASTTSGTHIVMSVNTRAKTGSVYDFRCTETHRVSICDDFVARCLQIWALISAGKKLKNDTFLADGVTPDPNQKIYAGTLVPSKVKKQVLVKVLRDMEREQLLQEVDASVAGAVCQKSSVNSGRIEAQSDLWTIDHAHQFLMRVNEISPG